MPYVSPLGIQTSKPPPKKLPQSKASQARSAAASANSSPRLTASSYSTTSSNYSTVSSDQDGLKHIPAKELGEVSSRDRDARVVLGLAHWKGWNARRESEDEGEEVDPLDEGVVKGDAKAVDDITVKVEEIGMDS
jgi:hypothetical protein